MSLQRAHCACIMRLSKNNNWHIFLESLIIKKPEEANADPCCNMAEINQWPPSTGQRPNYSRVNYQPCDSLCLLSRPTGGKRRWGEPKVCQGNLYFNIKSTSLFRSLDTLKRSFYFFFMSLLKKMYIMIDCVRAPKRTRMETDILQLQIIRVLRT